MTLTTSVPAATDRAARPDRRPWFMLAVLLLGQFMALLDVTVVNVAMTDIRTDLHTSGAALQLVVSGYTVGYAMLLITGARLGELYGRRRLFVTGTIAFTVFSLLCGLAPGAGVLIAARIAQGAGAALMMPQVISVIQAQFTGPARAKALSAYTAVISVAFVAGQVVGGVLVGADLFGAGWRPIFLVNVPIGVVVAVLAAKLVPGGAAKAGRRLDLAGLAIAVPAVVLVVLPLVLGHETGWPAWTFASIAAGVLLAVLFVVVERRVRDPLVNLEVLRDPRGGAGAGRAGDGRRVLRRVPVLRVPAPADGPRRDGAGRGPDDGARRCGLRGVRLLLEQAAAARARLADAVRLRRFGSRVRVARAGQ